MSLSDRYLKKYEYSGSKRYELSQKRYELMILVVLKGMMFLMKYIGKI